MRVHVCAYVCVCVCVCVCVICYGAFNFYGLAAPDFNIHRCQWVRFMSCLILKGIGILDYWI